MEDQNIRVRWRGAAVSGQPSARSGRSGRCSQYFLIRIDGVYRIASRGVTFSEHHNYEWGEWREPSGNRLEYV